MLPLWALAVSVVVGFSTLRMAESPSSSPLVCSTFIPLGMSISPRFVFRSKDSCDKLPETRCRLISPNWSVIEIVPANSNRSEFSEPLEVFRVLSEILLEFRLTSPSYFARCELAVVQSDGTRRINDFSRANLTVIEGNLSQRVLKFTRCELAIIHSQRAIG